eukprot:TRINITY_DN5114_c0_g1_i1.p1 TRINITY_DN5114_c0_g1~~TRINITY_DN5114_c0_g1_i1.p1  ORF type:complete len:150 (-),score=36.71 TRINITY_DN5114_c0_g1_i1:203-652(-)
MCIRDSLKGVFNVTKAVLARPEGGMIARKQGVILMISSAAGVMPIPNMSVYNASKFGLEGLTKVLAAELQAHGIRCNSISPGRVVTDSFPSEFGMLNPQTVRQPEDIKESMIFLLTDEASNGQYVHAGQWDYEHGIRGDGDALAHLTKE